MMSLKTGLIWLPLMAGALVLSIHAATTLERPHQQEGFGEDEGVTTVGPSDLISNDGSYRVHWTHPDGELEFGERFKMMVELERADGKPFEGTLAIDSRMPEHSHGMKREPRIVELEAGRYEVSGMLFHMPGYWEIYFDVTRGAVTERAQVPVDLY